MSKHKVTRDAPADTYTAADAVRDMCEWLTLQDIETFLRTKYPKASLVQVVVDHQRMQINAEYVKPTVIRGVWGLDGVEQFPPKSVADTRTPGQ